MMGSMSVSSGPTSLLPAAFPLQQDSPEIASRLRTPPEDLGARRIQRNICCQDQPVRADRSIATPRPASVMRWSWSGVKWRARASICGKAAQRGTHNIQAKEIMYVQSTYATMHAPKGRSSSSISFKFKGIGMSSTCRVPVPVPQPRAKLTHVAI